jgi:hypothetical protein
MTASQKILRNPILIGAKFDRDIIEIEWSRDSSQTQEALSKNLNETRMGLKHRWHCEKTKLFRRLSGLDESFQSDSSQVKQPKMFHFVSKFTFKGTNRSCFSRIRISWEKSMDVVFYVRYQIARHSRKGYFGRILSQFPNSTIFWQQSSTRAKKIALVVADATHCLHDRPICRLANGFARIEATILTAHDFFLSGNHKWQYSHDTTFVKLISWTKRLSTNRSDQNF